MICNHVIDVLCMFVSVDYYTIHVLTNIYYIIYVNVIVQTDMKVNGHSYML